MSEYLSEKDLVSFRNEPALVGGTIDATLYEYRKSATIRSGTPYKAIARSATIVDRLKVQRMITHKTTEEIAKELGLTVGQVRDLARN